MIAILLNTLYYFIYTITTYINKHSNPYIQIYFNENNDIYQFEKDNTFIDLLIIDINDKPIFLTHNNAKINVTIVKLNDHRYSLYKPAIECFNDNINDLIYRFIDLIILHIQDINITLLLFHLLFYIF